MNQVTNLVQYKNLTDDEKAAFDFENYAYEWQRKSSWSESSVQDMYDINSEHVYRLKIEPEKWYYNDIIDAAFTGQQLLDARGGFHNSIRPAKPSEIPKPEPSLEDRVKAEYPDYDVVMLRWVEHTGRLKLWMEDALHIEAQSMKGFYKYVYIDQLNDFYLLSTPIGHGSKHPIAVLFEKAKSC